uniref:Uncharacterized protein n=1 Tax=Arundo donax TaxID=35708 RepID=A0A0A9CPB9_ARUDO
MRWSNYGWRRVLWMLKGNALMNLLAMATSMTWCQDASSTLPLVMMRPKGSLLCMICIRSLLILFQAMNVGWYISIIRRK